MICAFQMKRVNEKQNRKVKTIILISVTELLVWILQVSGSILAGQLEWEL